MSWDRLSDDDLTAHIERMTARCTAVLAMTEEQQQQRKDNDGCTNLDSAVVTAHLLAGALAEWDRRYPDEDGTDREPGR